MVQPNTYLSVLCVLIVSAVCWGSWANFQKLAGGRWRFELFSFDFAFGAALCVVLAAFTLGSMDSRELTFQDNFLITGYRNIAYAAAAGMVFNLGNMFLMGAIAVSGLALAFPVGLGMVVVSGVVVNYAINPQADPYVVFSGAALVLGAMVLAGAAYTSNIDARRIAADRAAVTNPDAPRRRRLPRAARGIALSALAGLILSFFFPLLTNGAWAEPAISPYGTALLFAGGVLISTLLYNPFFMNFPVQGRPLEIKAYFKGGKREHLLGLLAGAIWMAGGLSGFVAVNSSAAAQLGLPLSFALGQGGLFVGTLWGLLGWREFQGSGTRAKLLLAGMFLCFGAGLTAIAIAPVYAK
jgi:glucose uptake protein